MPLHSIKDHGIPQADIDTIFNDGEAFYGLPEDVKEEHVWIPDRYLGWRSQSNLESVTGSIEFALATVFDTCNLVRSVHDLAVYTYLCTQATNSGSGPVLADLAQAASMFVSRYETASLTISQGMENFVQTNLHSWPHVVLVVHLKLHFT